MSKAKFTKGEWVAFIEDNLEHSTYEGGTIGDGGYHSVSHGALEYDAHLIAAAPEMYKRLQWLESLPILDLEERKKIRYLLTKARGVI